MLESVIMTVTCIARKRSQVTYRHVMYIFYPLVCQKEIVKEGIYTHGDIYYRITLYKTL